MNEKAKELINLLYTDKLTQFGKRQLADMIEKQQKEIEELKKDNNHQWGERCRLTFDIEKNFISKDKIREKIKEYDDFYKEYPIEFRKYKMRPITVVLKELLEEE